MKFFGREPALFLNLLAAALTMLVAIGVIEVTQDQLGYIMLAAAAVVAVGTAFYTKDITLGVIVGAFEAVFAALFSFGVQLTPEVTAAILGVVATVFGLFQRTQTTPARGFNTE